ncbi:MAG TPA: sugar phosphate isomerase/epimerase family protein [Methylomirabilota bacterium]|jgi:sugar phosphate isomerase/epimerase|nr:sugar phosphate isomerase/epimerase family protein [Methylomirabilota bacterium]
MSARFRLALCNEVLRELDFAAQCAYAAALGYDGLEVAPFTLGEEPHRLPAARRAELRRMAADAGLAVVGLHWLLVTPSGLTLNGPDDGARARTVDVMRRLVGLCADLGGSVMVHGSPAQRSVAASDDPAAAWARARDALAQVAAEAGRASITYCVEPLAPRETNFVNTLEEAVALVRAVGHPALRAMIDTSAAGQAEREPVPALIERWVPTGMIGHVQLNDVNQRGPGQGDMSFAPILAALRRVGYAGVVSVEPFDYVPDGRGAAARAIGYLRGLEESLAG